MTTPLAASPPSACDDSHPASPLPTPLRDGPRHVLARRIAFLIRSLSTCDYPQADPLRAAIAQARAELVAGPGSSAEGSGAHGG